MQLAQIIIESFLTIGLFLTVILLGVLIWYARGILDAAGKLGPRIASASAGLEDASTELIRKMTTVAEGFGVEYKAATVALTKSSLDACSDMARQSREGTETIAKQIKDSVEALAKQIDKSEEAVSRNSHELMANMASKTSGAYEGLKKNIDEATNVFDESVDDTKRDLHLLGEELKKAMDSVVEFHKTSLTEIKSLAELLVGASRVVVSSAKSMEAGISAFVQARDVEFQYGPPMDKFEKAAHRNAVDELVAAGTSRDQAERIAMADRAYDNMRNYDPQGE